MLISTLARFTVSSRRGERPTPGRDFPIAGKVTKGAPKGTFVVADLAGCADAVYVRAAPACRRSVAPPLPDEAYASPGLWEMRSPLETLPDGERGSAPFDPLARDERRGTGVLHETTGPGDMCGDAAA